MDHNIQRLKRQLTSCLVSYLCSSNRSIELPDGGRLIWSWFGDMSRARSWHANGPNPISYSDIAAYAALMRWPLRPYEIEMIRSLDQTYVNEWHSNRQRDKDEVRKLPQRSDQAVSPALFDLSFQM